MSDSDDHLRARVHDELERSRGADIQVDVDLTPVVAELFAKKIPFVQAQTARGLADLVAERMSADKSLAASDVLAILRHAADFYDSCTDDAD